MLHTTLLLTSGEQEYTVH